MAMSWLTGASEPPASTGPDLQSENQKLREENQKLQEQFQKSRASNYNLLRESAHRQDILRNELEVTKMNSLGIPNDPDKVLRDFNWDSVNQQRQPPAPTPAPTPGPEYITRDEAKKMAEEAAKAVLSQQVTTTHQQIEKTNILAQKFAQDQELQPHRELVNRLWHSAVRLNPEMAQKDPDKLYEMVTGEARTMVKDLGYNRPKDPAPNPYMPPGVNPQHPYYSQEQNSLWEPGFDANSHKSEVEERIAKQKTQFGL